ncbi:MAG: phosphoribosylformylglycinamidine cyclo-ligase [Spirochaetia bacterium]
MATYRDAGVNTSEAARLVERIKDDAERTRQPQARGEIGAFGAFYELPTAERPLLVSSTDGVGTKLEPALAAGRYRAIGRDCVAMCANDILCHGARPLFFLDYLACGKLNVDVAAEIVAGMTEACSEIGCVLSGGETAEMPGFYAEGTYDVAGFIVGMVESSHLIDGSKVAEGDVLIGLGSSGVHSNGFSLIRALPLDWDARIAASADGESPPTLRDALLEPTILYGPAVLALLEEVDVHGLAHITGGGMAENIPRMAKQRFRYEIDRLALPRRAVFDEIARADVGDEEMFHTFNMGIGFVIAVSPHEAHRSRRFLEARGLEAVIMGHVASGAGASGDNVCIV